MKRPLFLLALLTICIRPYAQNKVDSLANVADQSNDSVKFKIYGDLCWNLKFSNPDQSIDFGKRSIQSAQKLKSNPFLAQAHSDIGMVYYLTGSYALAKLHYDSSLVSYEAVPDSTGMAKIYGRIGAINEKVGKMDEALENFFVAIELNQALGNDLLVSYDLNNIAIVYMDQKQFRKSLEYFFRSLRVKEKLNDQVAIAGTLMNIGSVYQSKRDKDSAIFYYEKSIELGREVNQPEYLAGALNNYGSLLAENGQFLEAEKALKEALQIREVANDQRGLASSNVNLGNALVYQGKFVEAKDKLDKGLAIALELNAREITRDAYSALANLYEQTRDYKKSISFHKLFIVANDSFLNEETTTRLSEMRTRYETDKKEREISLLNKERQLQEAKIERNNLALVGAAGLIILILIIAIILYKQRDLKARARLEEEKSKLKSEQIHAVISSQENERKRFAMDLHDDFGQLISALKLNVSKLTSESTQVMKSEEILDTMYSSLKNIAFDLMPHTLFEKGLEEAINELKDQVNASGELQMDFQSFEIQDSINDEQKVAVYRIVQELVSNTIKYADASKINISITDLGNGFSLIIEDNGSGFDFDEFKNSKGNGWKNIRSRLDLLKGEIEFDTRPDRKNTTVSIEIPYQGRHDAAVA